MSNNKGSGIPASFIQEVVQRSDIVQYIGRSVRLKRNGNEYGGLCPFHKEKTPSFTVNADKQVYYCHGCGKGGNIITFLTEYERRNFVESIELLAQVLGLTVPRSAVNPEAQKKKVAEQEILYQLLEQTTTWYKQQLSNSRLGQQTINYLQGRGVTGETAKAFALGYAPQTSNGLLAQTPKKNEKELHHLQQVGLIKKSEQNHNPYIEYFRNRLIFPIRDVRGRVIAFGGRALDQQSKAKYLNSPETELYVKSEHLYGLYEATQIKRHHPYLLIVEGYMDTLMCHQYGLNNTIAASGTTLSHRQLELALRYTEKIIFCFDGDAAGRRAANKVIESAMTVMRDGLTLHFLFMPDGSDPDDLLQDQGLTAMQNLIDNAISLSTWFCQYIEKDTDINSIEGQALIIEKASPYLKLLRDSSYKQLLIGDISKRLTIESTELQSMLARHNDKNTMAAPMGTVDYGEAAADTAWDELPNDFDVDDLTGIDNDDNIAINLHPPGQDLANSANNNKASHSSPNLKLPSLAQQMLSLLLFCPSLGRYNAEYCNNLITSVKAYVQHDPLYPALIGVLEQLHLQPQLAIDEISDYYQKNFPEQPAVETLLGLADSINTADNSTTREEQLQSLLDNITKGMATIHKRQIGRRKATAARDAITTS